MPVVAQVQCSSAVPCSRDDAPASLNQHSRGFWHSIPHKPAPAEGCCRRSTLLHSIAEATLESGVVVKATPCHWEIFKKMLAAHLRLW